LRVSGCSYNYLIGPGVDIRAGNLKKSLPTTLLQTVEGRSRLRLYKFLWAIEKGEDIEGKATEEGLGAY